jgi:hypothetical protein
MSWVAGLAPASPPGAPMTREGAQRLVQSFVRAQGLLQSPGLNEQGFGGISTGASQLYFEWHEDTQTLECSALIYKFHDPPKPGVLETFQAEEKEGTDTGGGTVDYEPENRGLYLSRMYTQVPDERTFAKDMKRLVKASHKWSEEVLDRVASRVFHPEELEEKR